VLKEYANEAETSLKLFQAVSVFWFSFIAECATVFTANVYSRRPSKIYEVYHHWFLSHSYFLNDLPEREYPDMKANNKDYITW